MKYQLIAHPYQGPLRVLFKHAHGGLHRECPQGKAVPRFSNPPLQAEHSIPGVFKAISKTKRNQQYKTDYATNQFPLQKQLSSLKQKEEKIICKR